MKKETRKREISSAFGAIFRRIRRREKFLSPPPAELGERILEALIAAALAKCVDFNVAVNRARRNSDEEFLFVSALRGICEDLISLAYISTLPANRQQEISKLLIKLTLADGLQVQKAFFLANNPFQPVLVPPRDSDTTSPGPNLSARHDLAAFWAAQGITRKSGPTVKEMASQIGLKFTYDYIYLRLRILFILTHRLFCEWAGEICYLHFVSRSQISAPTTRRYLVFMERYFLLVITLHSRVRIFPLHAKGTSGNCSSL